MENQLQINMLGGFSLQYNGKVIDYQSSRSHKLWLILEYLITFRDKEITQNELIELLWGDEFTENPANTLKTLLHRLRTMLEELDFAPGKEMIIYNRGIYAWNPKLNFVVDTDQFLSLCTLGDEAEDAEQKVMYYLSAIDYYKGDFLPKSALEPWVVPVNTYYHSEYLRIVHACVELLKEQKRVHEIITVCQHAVSIDPYEETLHYELIKAMLETGAQQTALNHYEYVVDLFYSEFGINLSEAMTDLYKELIKVSNGIEVDLKVISEKLQEEDNHPGAFYCEYSIFREIYQLETRSASRNGQSVYLCMLSVTDGNNHKVSNRKHQNAAMGQLRKAIQFSLRRGDVFTRYSVTQYLILLPTISYENCEMVLKRIIRNFKADNPHSKVTLTYKMQSIDQKI
ncbi:MAG: winged helix-turn-helix domain-containing protein [Peptococcaceae bacterium]|nr:winged helix-turn-helix domain-containing protein [Peptococcaceae bacterium]